MSAVFFCFSVFLLLLYTVWQLINLWGWRKTVATPPGEVYDSSPETPVSGTMSSGPRENPLHPSVALLVPFRNEAANLASLAASLQAQDYPGQLDLIFIDDHSSDGGADLLPPEVIVLELADHLRGRPTVAHKKAALTYAISTTEAEVIITTDADCHWPADRVSRIAAGFAAGADVVLGPVLINPTDGLCNAYQALDLAAYQFLTAATAYQGRPALANGANFAFRRELFVTVGGYGGVDHLPSGDDVLLLHKFYSGSRAGTQETPSPTPAHGGGTNENAQRFNVGVRRPKTNAPHPGISPVFPSVNQGPGIKNRESQIPPSPPVTRYLPRAAVSTAPVHGWRALWRQRLRWAGKAGNYNNPVLTFAQALTFVLSAAMVLSLITFPLHLRPRLIIVLWGGKTLIDLVCLVPVMKQFRQTAALRWYPLVAIVYPFFLVGVGSAALLGFTTKWKGRG